MKKSIMVAVVLLASVLVPVAVHAGFKSTNNVGTDGSTFAGGSLGDARASADSVQYIGCDVYTNTGSGPTVRCIARNSANTFLQCSSTDPKFITVATAIASHSYISFNVSGGACTFLQVSDYSYFRPMTP